MNVRGFHLPLVLAVAVLWPAASARAQAVGDSVPMTRVVVPTSTPEPAGRREAQAATAQVGQVVGGAILQVPVPMDPPVTEQPVGARAAAAGSDGSGEIKRSRPTPGSEEATAEAAPTSALGGAAWETLRVILGLGVVLGLIIGMKMGAGRILGLKSAGPKANKGVRVLSRTMMGPRQQLVLLQVGRKLVLVSDSGGQVSTVTEVTDPDEVAELAAQALGSGEGISFGSSLGRQVRLVRASGVEVLEDEEESWDALPDVRAMGDARMVPEGRSAGSRAESLPGEVDLAGLSERVRLLGRRFSATQ